MDDRAPDKPPPLDPFDDPKPVLIWSAGRVLFCEGEVDPFADTFPKFIKCPQCWTGHVVRITHRGGPVELVCDALDCGWAITVDRFRGIVDE